MPKNLGKTRDVRPWPGLKANIFGLGLEAHALGLELKT